jgi:hypothetical protein
MMPQLHLYVSDKLAARAREHAEREGVSLSRYLAEVVRREVGEGWPEGFFDAVIGGWQGEPLARPPQGEPEARDDL